MAGKKNVVAQGKKAASHLSAEMPFAENALYVGIDLGTSRAAISATNGFREEVPTYVGYPKDNISQELLGTEPVFGRTALKHSLSLNLIRPLARGVIQDDETKNTNLKAAQELVRYLLKRVNAEPGQAVYGVIGAPARASIQSRKILIEATKGILDAVMICSEPFSVAYGLNILDQALIVDIGAGTIDLCRMHGTMPKDEDQITIDKAGDYIDQRLSELITKKYPEAQFTINMVRALKEQHGFVSENIDHITTVFPVKGRPTEFDVTDELRQACRSIVPFIVEAIEKLIGTYSPEFQDVLKNRIILAGGGSQIIGLPKLIEEGMKELGGGKVTRVEEPVYGGANGALKMAQNMPRHFWQMLK